MVLVIRDRDRNIQYKHEDRHVDRQADKWQTEVINEREVETSLDYCNAVVVTSLIVGANTASHVHI